MSSELLRRIARIKLTRFIDAFATVFPEIDFPDQLPHKLRCLLPDHVDRTASFYLRDHRWHCFRCGRGGDVVDFAQHYYDLKVGKAVKLVEAAMGLGDGKHADLQALVHLARADQQDKASVEWRRVVDDVEDEYTNAVRPYRLCDDTIVKDVALSEGDYVYEELERARREPPSRTKRGARQRSRRLRKWAMGWATGLQRFVEDATGKDVLDVSLQRIRPHDLRRRKKVRGGTPGCD